MPAPFLVTEPIPGQPIRWADGAEVEILVYHAEGATPVPYRLVRVR